MWCTTGTVTQWQACSSGSWRHKFLCLVFIGKILVEKWVKTSKTISKNHGYQTWSISIRYKGQNSKLTIDVNFVKKKINLVQAVLVQSKKHEIFEEHKTNSNNVKACHNFFSPRNTTSSNSDSRLLNHLGEATSHSENNISAIENTSLPLAWNQNSIILSFNNKAKREAEIIWSLFCLRHGFSYNSMASFLSTLWRMFPVVDNIKNFALGKYNIKYYMNYGICPYLKESLKAEVNNSPFIVTCFDESLNKRAQNCELALHISEMSKVKELK